MGKIRDRRQKVKKRKQIVQFLAGWGVTVVFSLFLFLVVNGFGKWLDSIESSIPEEIATESLLTDWEPLVTEDEPETMQIVMVGDMLIHDKILKSAKQEDGSYNFDHLFVHTAEFISSADLAIANQETIIGGERYGYTGYPSFNTPHTLIDAEVKAGFDVLLLATNHVLDKTKNGTLNCMEYLDNTYPDLGYVGINHSQEEQDNHIYTYEANGITVAILNYTYGTNGLKIPEDMPYLVNMLDEDKIRSDIRKAEEIADFTILCPHWGTEYKLEPDRNQKKWANIFLEEGVDLVLGSHPHVIEPVEWLTHENGNKMLVYYSVGNFVNGTASSGHGVSNRMVGGIADITLERNEETGEVSIIRYDAIPIVCHIAEGTEYSVYYLDDYTEELASENRILLQDSEFSKALCESLVDQVWGEE